MVKIKYIPYPEDDEQQFLKFQIQYTDTISPSLELMLKTWKDKYFYYAIDDIIYNPQIQKLERKKILSILSSTAIALQNNFCINFFNIWIWDVSITQLPKFNKFIAKSQESNNILTIILFYKKSVPTQKVEPLW